MIYAALLWIALSSLIGCALSLLNGSLAPVISLVSLSASLLLAGFAWRRQSLPMKSKPVGFSQEDSFSTFSSVLSPVLMTFLYAVVFAGIYFHSVFLFFNKNGQWWIQNPFNLGDMSFHWGVIRFLAKGAHFWPENPIFMGHRFRYPFGIDLFNAFFENLHIPIWTHLPLVTLGCLLLTFYMLHLTGGPLLVFAIFFSGGLYNFFQPGVWDLTQIQAGLDFKNLFLSVLLTQRGFLYALPAALLLYHGLQQSFEKIWTPSFSEKIGFGILWGALGFFHLHSFFFVSLYLGCLILWHRQWKVWAGTVILAGVIGAPFVLNALWPDADTTSLIHWSRGWARGPEVNFFSYWLQNLGPWIVCMVLALVHFYRSKEWARFFPLALAAGLFVLFSHLILAPWDWDNIKLLLWCYIFGLLAMSQWLWYSRSPAVRALVCLVFFLPGFLLFVRSMPLYSHGIFWVSEREISKAEVLLAGHDVNLGLAIAPAYDHPALLLGYKLFMGYPGHVWSHGYSYGDREALLERYFKGDGGAPAELLKQQVHLIYQGPFEKTREAGRLANTNEAGWQAPKGLFKLGEALDHELYKIE